MNKEILRLAVPNIISNITVPLVGMFDLAMMGHFGSVDHIGALALGSMIFNFIYWGFSFLRMGTSAFTAQAYGARKLKETILALSRAMFVAIICTVVILGLQKPIAWLSFSLMEGSEQVEMFAMEYFRIRIWAAPAAIGLFAMMGWFIGMQNARFPMIIALTINLLNVGFNFVFVLLFDMKSEGVALGTVLAQYCGFFLALFLFYRYYRRLLKHWTFKAMIQLKALKQFFLVNRDIFIRTMSLIFVFTFFTAESARIDTNILAVNTILLQYFMIFSYLIDGFAYSAEALVGKYVGALNRVKLKKVVIHLFKWGLGIGTLFTLIYLVAGRNLIYLLTDEIDIIEGARPYLIWIYFVPLLTFSAFIWDGIYTGATATIPTRNAMIISASLFFVTYYFLRANLQEKDLWFGSLISMKTHILWFSFMLFMIGRGLFQTLFAKKAILNKISL